MQTITYNQRAALIPSILNSELVARLMMDYKAAYDQ